MVAHVAFSASTLFGGGVDALQNVALPPTEHALTLASVSGYVLVGLVNSQKFYWINPGEIVIDPLNFAEKESNPDNIVAMSTVGDQVVIGGSGSAENWYATGDPTAPFAPIEGRVYARGVVKGTMVPVQEAVIAVGNDGIVYEFGAASGVKRISDHGIEERIRRQLRREQGLQP